MNIADQLLTKYPIISDQVDIKELGALLRELEKTLRRGATGNIVEFGCYVGTTSLFIRRLLDAYDFTGEFHVYDSFAGLPEKTQKDNSAAGDQFKAGELLAPENIMFAFFDGDFYESIVDSFRVCESKFNEDAIIIVDDYANEALPGAAKATDEWLKVNRQFAVRTEASLAIISSCPKT